ncbi:MAG: M20 family metallo-hydrolase [Anaerolineales bacterium]|nr:M20 family metallo-hydrolase [Anaerolineales bacterium]
MNRELGVNSSRLLARLDELAQFGAMQGGGITRLALSDADRDARDRFVSWLEALGLAVYVDAIGNILGFRPGGEDLAPVLFGSHLDTVRDAGRFDGAYGVLAALEVLETLIEVGLETRRPLAVVAFTNEEGVRFPTDMLGSNVYSGALSLEEAYAVPGFDGLTVGDELRRIGYAGEFPPGALKPYAYVELHIEQGPILDRSSIPIGVVETVTGISWKELTICGAANHAGTTPMDGRRDAGLAAARIITGLRQLTLDLGGDQRATCGMLSLEPGAVNVIPGRAVLTVDLRNGDESTLEEAERRLAGLVAEVAQQEGVTITARKLARVRAVAFNPMVPAAVEAAAADLHLASLRMGSGAGHDAQVMAGLCPAGMVFIPSRDGISHSPHEYSSPEALAAGANVLLRTVMKLAE